MNMKQRRLGSQPNRRCEILSYSEHQAVSLYLGFCNRFGSCRRLVGDNERRILVERTGNRDLLSFTTGNVNAVIGHSLIAMPLTYSNN